jgi:hypothetical protein
MLRGTGPRRHPAEIGLRVHEFSRLVYNADGRSVHMAIIDSRARMDAS